MGYVRIAFWGSVLLWGWVSFGLGEEYSLPYFLTRLNSKPEGLSKQEKMILIDQVNRVLEKVREVHGQMTHRLQTGAIEMSYQEGDHWISRLKEDRKSIEEGLGQTKLLRERPGHLVGALQLYKSLKDLSANLNAYNNIPSFSALVGDLAPELGLWADPVYYQLYLIPLAREKDIEKGPPPKAKKPPAPLKKP